MLVSNIKNKLLKRRKMKTTERFDKAVTKLYNAFHNGELNANSCCHCAVGNICDNVPEWNDYRNEIGKLTKQHVSKSAIDTV